MKKIIALTFSLVLILSLAACGNDTNMGNDISNGASSIVSDTESIISDITGNNNSNNQKNNNSDSSASAKISRDEAKSIALKHAGIDEKNITGLDIDLDRDNGSLEYEIEFHSGGMEYDYDINAQTGEIINSHKEND